MKYLTLSLLMIFTSCSHPYEMEEVSKDVLKYKEGIQIEVEPIPKGK